MNLGNDWNIETACLCDSPLKMIEITWIMAKARSEKDTIKFIMGKHKIMYACGKSLQIFSARGKLDSLCFQGGCVDIANGSGLKTY